VSRSFEVVLTMFRSQTEEVDDSDEKSTSSPPPRLSVSSSSSLPSSDVPALIQPPSSPSSSPSLPSPANPLIRYSLLVDVPENDPPSSHVSARVDFLASLDKAVAYDSLHPPPDNWLSNRHRTLPAVFRDTFSSHVFWSAEQQKALRDCFAGWDGDDSHSFHLLYGDVVPSATRVKPAQQRGNLQSHTVKYYIDHLRSRKPSTLGLIIYNVKIHNYHATQPFRFGPAICDFYAMDLYQCSPADTELTMIAGMKNTWTPVHVDDGGDSTWSMAIEGYKVWIFGRAEQREAFSTYFNRSFTWTQLQPADRQFLVSNHCIMIHQRPGDIVYVPCGWPHMVKHLTDTLSINSSLLNSWDAANALDAMDLNKWSREEWLMFTGAYERAVLKASSLMLTHLDLSRLTEVWDRKRAEAEEDRNQRRRLR
jgi:hypothetical protein